MGSIKEIPSLLKNRGWGCFLKKPNGCVASAPAEEIQAETAYRLLPLNCLNSEMAEILQKNDFQSVPRIKALFPIVINSGKCTIIYETGEMVAIYGFVIVAAGVMVDSQYGAFFITLRRFVNAIEGITDAGMIPLI